MIIDSSAIMAILLEEAEGPPFSALITRSTGPRISAGTWIELSGILVKRFGGRFDDRLPALANALGLSIVPVDLEQAQIGAAAYRRYGQGAKHLARLNFGDCFAYALAKATGAPLLFKGDDFVHTDIVPAIDPGLS